MYQDHSFMQAIQQLGKRNNISITLSGGATALTLDDGLEVWLEHQRDGHLAVLHTEVKSGALFEKDIQFWQKCLEINTDLNSMCGFWLGLARENNSIRLCCALPKKFIDIETLDDTLAQLAGLTKKIESMTLN